MNFKQEKKLEGQLGKLCRKYKVPKKDRPELEFCPHSSLGAGEEWSGFYNKIFNEIWIYDSMTWKETVKTLRHEFGHFILYLRDPKRKYHKGEETICRMMERTLLRFPHLINNNQSSLDAFMGELAK